MTAWVATLASIFPFRVSVSSAALFPSLRILIPGIAVLGFPDKIKVLSVASSLYPTHRNVPAPLPEVPFVDTIKPFVPIELLEPAIPIDVTYSFPELPNLKPPPKELSVELRVSPLSAYA